MLTLRFVMLPALLLASPGCDRSTVRARAFILEDESGHQRGALRLEPTTSAAQLLLQDASGRLRVSIQFDRDQNPALFLLDEKEQVRVQLGLEGVGENRVPFLTLATDDGGDSGLAAVGAREPSLLLRAEGSNQAIRLKVGRKGESISLTHADGTTLEWPANRE